MNHKEELLKSLWVSTIARPLTMHLYLISKEEMCRMWGTPECQPLGLKDHGVQGLGFRVYGFRVKGLGFRV